MIEQAEDTKQEIIAFEDFLKVDIRVGRIDSAERVPKSDKLLKLQVDFGELGKRQILAGIGKTYSPEAIVGQVAPFVVNLHPRKMMGLESHGMILAGKHRIEEVHVAVPLLDDSLVIGSRLG